MNEANEHRDAPLGHEPDAVSVRAVTGTVVGLVILVISTLVLLYAVLNLLARATPVPPAPSLVHLPPETSTAPRLNPAQFRQLRDLRAQETEILSTYGWVDRKAGVARIPIERAIEIMAQDLATQHSEPEKSDGR
jgi:hypothetical protein